MSIKAYQRAATQAEQPRELEYRAFGQATAGLVGLNVLILVWVIALHTWGASWLLLLELAITMLFSFWLRWLVRRYQRKMGFS